MKTVSMYIKALYLNKLGLNVLFSEPTADLRDLLTKSKLNKIIQENDLFKNNVKGDLNIKDSFGRNLFLMYTFGNASALAYTVDCGIYDEVSRSNPETIDAFKSRQLNSKYKWEWFISNPTVPNDLLHRTFLQSDQKHWFVRCTHCQKEQLLNWYGMHGFKSNVCYEREQFVCSFCDEILDPQSIIDGRWIARYKGREISGYHIWQGMRPTKSLEEQHLLVKEMIYEEKKSKANFYSMFLGLPYSGSDIKVNKELIYENIIEPFEPKHSIVMGCDVGHATGHHYVIGSNNKIIKIGTAKDFDEIRQLIKEYKVQMMCIDNGPENESVKRLQQEYPNIVWRGYYLGHKTDDIVKYNEETGLVNISKHIYFDNIINDLGAGKYKFAIHKNDPVLDEFCEQFGALSKIPEFDRNGNPIFKWEAPEGVWDHYAHGFLYYTIAEHRLEQMRPKYGIFKSNDGETSIERTHVRNMEFLTDDEESKSWLDL